MSSDDGMSTTDLYQSEQQSEAVDVLPAFQALDELQETGEIPPFKLARLRAKYSEAFYKLERYRDHEASLLNRARLHTEELEEQRSTLADDQYTEEGDSEAIRMRQQLLEQMNLLRATEERIGQHDQLVVEFLKEKGELERQYARIKPSADEADQRKRELEREEEELKKENNTKRQEIEQLRIALEQKNRDAEREQTELKSALEEQENLCAELVGPELHSAPQQLQKEMDKLKRLNEQNRNKKEKLQEALNQLTKEIENESEGLKQKQADFSDARTHGEEEKIKLERNQQSENRMSHDLLLEKDRAHNLQIDLTELELNVVHATQDRKHNQEVLARQQRVFDRELRNQKRREQLLKVAHDSLKQAEQIYQKAKDNLDDMPNPDELLNQRKHLMKEVEEARRKVQNQTKQTSMEKVRHEEMLIEEEGLFHRQEQERATLVELSRIRQIKEDEREHKSRDLLRAQQRMQKIVTELRQRDLVLQDHKKRCFEVQGQQDDFAKLYDVIKNEKNKYVHLIQASTQKAAELREKLRVLANEVEILQGSATQKVKVLRKAELNHNQSKAELEALRNDKSKMVDNQNQIEQTVSSRKLEIDRLNMMSQRTEEDARNLLVLFEKAVQHRNERGVTLVEREEEVCIFYERLNVQEQMIRNGEVKVTEFDENLRFLKLQLQEEMRQIELLRRKKPVKRDHEDELVDLQINLSKARHSVRQLEEALTNPDRARQLGGVDLNIVELKKKLESIQLRLANIEEIALEKELLFQHVSRLVQKQEANSTEGKLPALELARQINAAQSQLKARTRTAMARVAELSIVKAKLVESERERVRLTELVEESIMRIERGLAPNQDAEQEWNRYCRNENRKKDDQTEEDLYPISDGCTTAVPRPNAYIPKDGSLPLPRPYGALAPFKPTQPGSTMRHFRKPLPKPIDI